MHDASCNAIKYGLTLFFIICICGAAKPIHDEDLSETISNVRLANVQVTQEASDSKAPIFSIFFPKGTYDPGSMRKMGKAIGGVSYKIKLKQSYECLALNYEIKFEGKFDFVHGGKLPGLAGGTANTGGLIPNGYDGFSVRFLWLGDGGGAAYAYLPTSKKWGDSLGPYKWKYKTSYWHSISQLIILNAPQKNNGELHIFFDGKLVFRKRNLVYRYSPEIKIDSFLLSSFFGGNSAYYGATKDSHVQIRNIFASNRLCNTE